MRRVLATLLTGLMLGACSTVEFTPTPSTPARAPHEGIVKVLRTYPPEGTYEHLGIVHAIGRALADEQDLLELASEVAAEHGANAIVVQGKPVIVRSNSGTQTRMAVTAIWQEP